MHPSPSLASRRSLLMMLPDVGDDSIQLLNIRELKSRVRLGYTTSRPFRVLLPPSPPFQFELFGFLAPKQLGCLWFWKQKEERWASFLLLSSLPSYTFCYVIVFVWCFKSFRSYFFFQRDGKGLTRFFFNFFLLINLCWAHFMRYYKLSIVSLLLFVSFPLFRVELKAVATDIFTSARPNCFWCSSVTLTLFFHSRVKMLFSAAEWAGERTLVS